MTKEDKQIIERATKEEWRIGDRTRLKRLLEKNLKQYRDNVELENKNKLLGERCNQLLKDKGDLTDQIADIKANCDLAIEGRDIKIMELEADNEARKFAMTMSEKVEKQLREENAELEKKNKKLESDFRICEKNADTYYDQLTIAKEILKDLLLMTKVEHLEDRYESVADAEQFLKEIEK